MPVALAACAALLPVASISAKNGLPAAPTVLRLQLPRMPPSPPGPATHYLIWAHHSRQFPSVYPEVYPAFFILSQISIRLGLQSSEQEQR